MAKIIKPDGTEVELLPADGKKFTLKELQTAVGGYIEMVPQSLHKGHVYCDEEGRIKDPPKRTNVKATSLCYRSETVPNGFVLLGDVIFLTEAESKAEESDDE